MKQTICAVKAALGVRGHRNNQPWWFWVMYHNI